MLSNIQQYYPSFYTFYENHFSRVRHPSHPGQGHGSLTCHMTQFERSDWLRSENFTNIMIELHTDHHDIYLTEYLFVILSNNMNLNHYFRLGEETIVELMFSLFMPSDSNSDSNSICLIHKGTLWHVSSTTSYKHPQTDSFEVPETVLKSFGICASFRSSISWS